MRPITVAERAELEALIDSVGLRAVVDALSVVAYDKADHIRGNWQDEGLARIWADDGAVLERVVTRIVN